MLRTRSSLSGSRKKVTEKPKKIKKYVPTLEFSLSGKEKLPQKMYTFFHAMVLIASNAWRSIDVVFYLLNFFSCECLTIFVYNLTLI